MTVLTILAKAPTGEAAKSGPWGLAVILILCAVCYFLFKSMSKHLRKVREDFPADAAKQPKPPTPSATTGTRPSLAKADPPAGQPDGIQGPPPQADQPPDEPRSSAVPSRAPADGVERPDGSGKAQ